MKASLMAKVAAAIAVLERQLFKQFRRDPELLRDCRILVLAMVAAWRCDPNDQLPDRQRAKRQLLNALRNGRPYPALDALMRAD